MKRSIFKSSLSLTGSLLLMGICLILCERLSAQENKPVDSLPKSFETDSVTLKAKNGSKRRVSVTFGTKNDDFARSPKVIISGKKQDRGHPIYGITFSRIDLGLTKIMDNGSFTLSDKNSFLKNRAWKTYNFGFDLLQAGYRFNDHFRIFVSGGFDWTFIRLREDIEFLRNTTPLQYRYTGIDYDKNRLASTYLRIPLTFEHRFADRKMRVAYGPIGGFLLSGSQRFKSDEEGKRKVKDDYNFTQFKYGAFMRWGYSGFGLYAKYYMNDLFENTPEQEGIKDFTFGLMLGF